MKRKYGKAKNLANELQGEIKAEAQGNARKYDNLDDQISQGDKVSEVEYNDFLSKEAQALNGKSEQNPKDQ